VGKLSSVARLADTQRFAELTQEEVDLDPLVWCQGRWKSFTLSHTTAFTVAAEGFRLTTIDANDAEMTIWTCLAYAILGL
jgi:hypothetical protein